MKKISLLLSLFLLMSCSPKINNKRYYISNLSDFKSSFYYFCIIDDENILYGKETNKQDSFKTNKKYTFKDNVMSVENKLFAFYEHGKRKVYCENLKLSNEEFRIFELSDYTYNLGV